jgi:N6-adenosine-specific RNA methylase IME4
MTTSERNCTTFSKRRKFGAIYADPPWSFRNWSAKGTGRNAISHYDCLDFASLAALPVADVAADDCALFLWATDPLLPRAIELIHAWGFEYKTVAFYWVKLNTKLISSPVSVTGRARTLSNACLQREGSRCVAQRMSAAWLLKNVGSIAENQIVCGSGSSDL